jgi:hypothetical protein
MIVGSGSVSSTRFAAIRRASVVYPASSSTDSGATVQDGNRRAPTLAATDPSAAPVTSWASSGSA